MVVQVLLPAGRSSVEHSWVQRRCSPMKYVVIIGDGMADWPLDELGGKTPLMAAHKPYMDMMASEGFCGKVLTIPDGYPSGSDVACMSIFGYSPAKYYTGRAPNRGKRHGHRDGRQRCGLSLQPCLP
ncbi:MAG: hypothetical protein MZV70_61845 [Desulfobacterales bacterium]|nr:hypothetical protein [Desulfobacterales bacterium]